MNDRALLLATDHGICRYPLDPEGRVGPLERSHERVAFEAICLGASGLLCAGTDAGQVYRSEDGGRTWRRVFSGFPDVKGLWAMAAHPTRPQVVYAGLEPAELWVSRDGGEFWEELIALRDHPAAEGWSFFEPMLPHVRAIACDRKGERLYVGIEEGGVLVSVNGGGSFEDKSRGVNEDVHTLVVAPNDPDLVYAMTGGGLFRSQDGGHRWERLRAGLSHWYFIPLAVLSSDATVLCVGAANTPPPAWRTTGADAAIYRSEDGGDHWRPAEGPFPTRGMVTSIVTDPEQSARLFVGTTDGVLLTSADGGASWRAAADGLPRIEEMLIAPR